MKACLICPIESDPIHPLLRRVPLAVLPMLGKPLAAYWIEHLQARGAREIRLFVSDRPDKVRRILGDGKRWGLQLEIIPAPESITVEEIRTRIAGESGWLAAPDDVNCMDRLPGSQRPVQDWTGLFTSVLEWMPRCLTADRVGIREAAPQVWVGMHTRISPAARIEGPCWIGNHVRIGPEAVIGPHAIVEDRVWIQPGAELACSWVLPDTLVGRQTALQNSIASGNLLINWKSGSAVEVADEFLLGSLEPERRRLPRPSWPGRVAAFLCFASTMPLVLPTLMKLKSRGMPAFRKLRAAAPCAGSPARREDLIEYFEIPHPNRWLRRWPQLMNIMAGTFTWVGNRPVTPQESIGFQTDFEQLWLAAPVGLVSLGDLWDAVDPASEEARAHASYYAVRRNWRLDASILWKSIWMTSPRAPAPVVLEPAPLPLKVDALKTR